MTTNIEFNTASLHDPEALAAFRQRQGPVAQKLRELSKLNWMMEVSYRHRHEVPGVLTLEEMMQDVEICLNHFGPAVEKDQGFDEVQAVIQEFLPRRRMDQYSRHKVEWDRVGGTHYALYWKWVPEKDEDNPEAPATLRAKLTQIIIVDKLEEVTYGGVPDNVNLVELRQALELMFANGDQINSEK